MQIDWTDEECDAPGEEPADELSLVKNIRRRRVTDGEIRHLLDQFTERIRRNHVHFSRDADVIASEAVLRAYKGIDSLQNDAAFFHWLFGIANNLVKERYQAEQRDRSF